MPPQQTPRASGSKVTKLKNISRQRKTNETEQLKKRIQKTLRRCLDEIEGISQNNDNTLAPATPVVTSLHPAVQLANATALSVSADAPVSDLPPPPSGTRFPSYEDLKRGVDEWCSRYRYAVKIERSYPNPKKGRGRVYFLCIKGPTRDRNPPNPEQEAKHRQSEEQANGEAEGGGAEEESSPQEPCKFKFGAVSVYPDDPKVRKAPGFNWEYAAWEIIHLEHKGQDHLRHNHGELPPDKPAEDEAPAPVRHPGEEEEIEYYASMNADERAAARAGLLRRLASLSKAEDRLRARRLLAPVPEPATATPPAPAPATEEESALQNFTFDYLMPNADDVT